MKRAPNALVAIWAFGVAVATLSAASTAGIVLLAPRQPALQTSPSEAVAALRSASPSFKRFYAPTQPAGFRTAMIEALLAVELGVPPADVRVVWPEGTLQGSARIRLPDPGAATNGSAKANEQPFVFIERQKGSFDVVSPSEAGVTIGQPLLKIPMPAFTAAVRQDDGRWLTVEPKEPLFSGWQRNLLLAILVNLLALMPISWILARRFTRPFRQLSGALAGDADVIPEAGPRELREAAAAIAAMKTRLKAEANERARILTAIAHDLRTPLTGLRLRIETAPEPQRSRMIADVERMQAMVKEVLTFASDAAAQLELVDVRPFIKEILADLDADGLRVSVLAGDEANVRAPRLAFRRVLENLVRNAIDYAGGGVVAISQSKGKISVTISDDGPGISEGDRERLLRPFERGDASRNRVTGGTGLGLSIVRDFAVQQRGNFELRQSQSGGTAAILTLPSATEHDVVIAT
jgi:signal transduction histidine kinase